MPSFGIFKGIVNPKSQFCNYLGDIILINTKKGKTRSFEKCSCCSVPYNKSGWGLGLTNSKKVIIRHNNNCDPYDSCYSFLI